jgi:hypothetical protein
MKWRQAFATPTSEIIRKYEMETNPVTKWVYGNIIGNRIDRQEMFRLNSIEMLKKTNTDA